MLVPGLAKRAYSQLSTLTVVSTLSSSAPRGKVIGTHDGHFHCDECLAVGMLCLLAEFESATVVRSRDPAVLAACDVVVDVGGTYDAESRRLDHHQRGFDATMTELGRSTKLSSAGLTYRHYGRDVLREAVLADDDDDPAKKKRRVEAVYPRVYATFVEHVDGIDNGLDALFVKDGTTAQLESRYEVSTTLSRRVARLNPRWNEQGVDVNARFKQAVQLCASEFLENCADAVASWLPARDLVADALDRAAAAPGGAKIVQLDTYCPWQAHIFDLEKQPGLAKYVLYPDSSREGAWRVHAVPVREGSFQSRLALPEPWRGLRDDALSEAAGIPDLIFVHASGFIGGAKTHAAAIALASKALDHDSACPRSGHAEPTSS